MPLRDRRARAMRAIRDQLATSGRAPSVRELAVALGYSSPRSAAVLIDELVAAGDLAKRSDGKIQVVRDDGSGGTPTVRVPVLGCAPCGAPFFAEENLEGHVRVDARLARPPHSYFALRAVGDSMNLAGIDDGALVLVRSTRDAHDGDRVVALVDGEATIKTLRHGRGIARLEPSSSNAAHEPVFATHDLAIQGVVVASLT